METLFDRLNEQEELFKGTTLFENPDFDDAAIGYTEDGKVIYDYDKMPECLMK